MPTEEVSVSRLLREAVDGRPTTPHLLADVQQRARHYRRKRRVVAGSSLVAVAGMAVSAGVLLSVGAGPAVRAPLTVSPGAARPAAPTAAERKSAVTTSAASPKETAADAPTFALGPLPTGLVVLDDGVLSPANSAHGYLRQVIYSKYATKAAAAAAHAVGVGPTIIVTIATGTAATGIFAAADVNPLKTVTVRGRKAYVTNDPNGIAVTWWEASGFAIRVSAAEPYGLPAALTVATAMGHA